MCANAIWFHWSMIIREQQLEGNWCIHILGRLFILWEYIKQAIQNYTDMVRSVKVQVIKVNRFTCRGGNPSKLLFSFIKGVYSQRKQLHLYCCTWKQRGSHKSFPLFKFVVSAYYNLPSLYRHSIQRQN